MLRIGVSQSPQEQYAHIRTQLGKIRPDSLVSQCVSLLDHCRKTREEITLIKTHYLLAWVHHQNSNYGEAVVNYLEAARFVDGFNSHEMQIIKVGLYKNLSNIISDYGYFDLAYKFLDEAVHTANVIDDSTEMVSILSNKMLMLRDEEKFDEARSIGLDLINTFQLSDEQRINVLNNLGLAYMNLNYYTLAKECFLEILKAPDTSMYELSRKSFALNNLGTIFYQMGDVQQALDFLNRSIQMKQFHGLEARSVIGSLTEAGGICYQTDRLREGLNYLEQAEQLHKSSAYLHPDTYELYDLLAKTHAGLGNVDQAIQYSNRYAEQLTLYLEEKRRIEEADKRHNIQMLTERYFDMVAADREKNAIRYHAQIGLTGATAVFVVILLFFLHHQLTVRRGIQRQILKIEALSEV